MKNISRPVEPDYKILWAKSEPRHSLWKHILDTSAVSLALPPPVGCFGWSAEETALLVGLHDIGKADAGFQHQVAEFSDELVNAGFPITADARCRHERISARWIKDKLTAEGLNPYQVDATARTVLAHHGYWNEISRGVGKEYAEAQNGLSRMLRLILGVHSFPMEDISDLSSFGMRLSGHIVLCDWIASNEKFFSDTRLKGIDDPAVYFITAKHVACDWVEQLGLDRDNFPGHPANIVEQPRPIQQVLLENPIEPGLVIIEAPMGEGKTEAAWILAEKWRDHGYSGMYMALPTMATSDSLHDRYNNDYIHKLGRGSSVKLVHGMAWLRDNKEPEELSETGESGDDRSLAAAWFRPTRRALLAAHGVGTVDQAMLAGMNVKFGFLRLYGLADRVLVIDEIHAYDAYMSAIIGRLLNWCACLRIPVILLSATLSSRQRTMMIEAYGARSIDTGQEALYPLVTVAQSGREAQFITSRASSRRTLIIGVCPGLLGNARKIADKAMELVETAGCCCVILNTVKQAQAVYTEITLPDNEKLLFHARFTASDRENITNCVLDMFGKGRWEGEGNNRRFKPAVRPEKFILVATQVVEQSLDIDFDHMISEIAPIDLLLQRSGRMHRHQKRDKDPILYVLLPQDNKLEFQGTGRVYAEKPLLRTLAIISAKCEVHVPDDFRSLIECCYGSSEWEQTAVSWDVIRKSDREWDKETQELNSQGKQFSLNPPSKRFFRPVNNEPTGDDSDDGNGWRAKTRLGANDRSALLVKKEELGYLVPGELPMQEVRSVYRRLIKLPGYLPFDSPASGYSPAMEAKGKLRGLMLLPVSDDGLWEGIDEHENRYQVAYDQKTGLITRRVR
ncbi:MAG: CRISPR-associated helicase Cas3' [Dehalococcoidales bacterium]|nr:CRISPR-associated helicase Cas3' [Dehalococcoidales bacterium]